MFLSGQLGTAQLGLAQLGQYEKLGSTFGNIDGATQSVLAAVATPLVTGGKLSGGIPALAIHGDTRNVQGAIATALFVGASLSTPGLAGGKKAPGGYWWWWQSNELAKRLLIESMGKSDEKT